MAYRERMKAGEYDPKRSAAKRGSKRRNEPDGERLKGFKVAPVKRARSKRDA